MNNLLCNKCIKSISQPDLAVNRQQQLDTALKSQNINLKCSYCHANIESLRNPNQSALSWQVPMCRYCSHRMQSPSEDGMCDNCRAGIAQSQHQSVDVNYCTQTCEYCRKQSQVFIDEGRFLCAKCYYLESNSPVSMMSGQCESCLTSTESRKMLCEHALCVMLSLIHI